MIPSAILVPSYRPRANWEKIVVHLKSMSATSAKVFECCPARWNAMYVTRAPYSSSEAADLGTVCHETLDWWVKAGYHAKPPAGRSPTNVLEDAYKGAYEHHFADPMKYDDGLQMVMNWYWRTRDGWKGRKVLSTEVKETFDLPYGDNKKVPFTFIWDRCDRVELNDGYEIEVVDYKTWVRPISPEKMRHDIQVRAYALAAQMKYKDAKRVRVTIDQLRYDAVSVAFDRRQNLETYRYLQRLAERIEASDGQQERLNKECLWCVRANQCKTLQKADKHTMTVSMNPDALADMRRQAADAKSALDYLIKSYDLQLLEYCQKEELFEFDTEETHVEITARSRRTIDAARAARVVGPDVMRQYPRGISMKVVDKLTDPSDDTLTSDQKMQLKDLVSREWSDPTIETRELGPFQ